MIDTSLRFIFTTPVCGPEEVIMLTYVDHHPDGGDANDEDDSLSDAPCGVCVQTSHYYLKKKTSGFLLSIV